MNQLFQTVRSRTSRANWSRGAQLARGGAVVVSSSDNGTVALSVAQKGQLACNVTLYPEQRDWECSCDSTEDVCQHVAAAVIAIRALKRAGVGEAQGQARPGHLGYRFERVDGRLALRRTIVLGRHEAPLTVTLAEALLGKHNGPPLHADEVDKKIEMTMGSYNGGPIPLSLMPRLLDALSDAGDIRYNGRPVRVGKPASGLCVRVEECGLGFRLRLDQDPAVNEVFQNGALRRGIKLRAVVPHGLGERRFMELRAGKIYEESEIGTLVGEVLPKLQLQLPVIVDTPKLPKVEQVKPRLQITTERDGEKLTLLAVIVYGDPPRARVDGDRLTLLSGREVPVRDMEAELPLKRMADGLGLELGFRRTFAGIQALAVARRVAEITDARVFITGDAYKEFYETDPLTPRLDIKVDGDFDLWFEPVGISGTRKELDDPKRADPYAVLRAWEQGNPLVPLLGGGFSRLPEDWLHKFGHRVRDLLAAREAMAESPDAAKAAKYLLPDLAAVAEALEMPPPAEFKKLRTLVDSFEGIPSAKLPAGVKATLRDYQKRGYDWLTFLRDAEMGALLADDMGLGKTLQTLCALSGRTLVVAPTSVLHNWESEITRFRPNLKTNLYHGPNRKLDKKSDVTLTTYAILRLDQELLAAEEWDTVVVDEAQAIKNPTSQVAKAAYGLNAKFRVALTGTPVENRLEDLWSQFHFLNRGLLGGRQDFNDRYVKPIAAGDPDAAGRLRQRVRPFVLRRLKSEVAKELPPRTEVVLRCELTDAERQVYDAVRAATREDVLRKLSADANDTLAVLEALLRLRQAACHPALLPGQKRFKNESSSKLDLLKELLDEALAEDHKALVFSQWTSLLDLVAQEFDKQQLAYTRLDGRTKDRKKVVTEFQDPAGPKVMLVSLKAGGTGLNLTAADHVVLLDPWWNPAVEDQAADRAHRIGQTRPVIVHRLVAEDTVEDRILKLQEGKRQLAEAALGTGNAAAQGVSREELMALLE